MISRAIWSKFLSSRGLIENATSQLSVIGTDSLGVGSCWSVSHSFCSSLFNLSSFCFLISFSHCLFSCNGRWFWEIGWMVWWLEVLSSSHPVLLIISKAEVVWACKSFSLTSIGWSGSNSSDSSMVSSFSLLSSSSRLSSFSWIPMCISWMFSIYSVYGLAKLAVSYDSFQLIPLKRSLKTRNGLNKRSMHFWYFISLVFLFGGNFDKAGTSFCSSFLTICQWVWDCGCSLENKYLGRAFGPVFLFLLKLYFFLFAFSSAISFNSFWFFSISPSWIFVLYTFSEYSYKHMFDNSSPLLI